MSTKVHIPTEYNNTLDSRTTVNLSNKSLAHRFDLENTSKLSFKQYANKEVTLCLRQQEKKDLNSPSNVLKTPPKRKKKLVQKGVSRKQASQIRRTLRILHFLSPNGKLSFLTLTYRKNYPTDLVAKKHLDSFFKRLKRSLGVKHLHYVWIAEKQKRGAIHYHIVFIDYIRLGLINKAWNGILHKWQKKNGFEKETVYPNIEGVTSEKLIQQYLTKGFKKIGGYMTSPHKQHKILPIEGNIWNRSTLTRKACKPILDHVTETNDYLDNLELYEDTLVEFRENPNYEVYEMPISDCLTKVFIAKLTE